MRISDWSSDVCSSDLDDPQTGNGQRPVSFLKKGLIMGWLFMPFTSMGGHKTAKSYLDAQLTYENTLEDGTKRGLRVLASSCPGNRTYYAAAQEIVEIGRAACRERGCQYV